MPGHLRHRAVRRKAASVYQPPPCGENPFVPRPGPSRPSIRTRPVRGTQSWIEPAQFVQVGLDLQGLRGAQFEIGLEVRLRLGIPL